MAQRARPACDGETLASAAAPASADSPSGVAVGIAWMRSRLLRSLTDGLVHRPRRRQLGITSRKTPLFQTVFFELRTRCNGVCSFCAASRQHETREDRTMPFDLYEKVIADLSAMNYEGQVAYHVNNEPLIVPDLPRFIAHARSELPRAWIRIYTNGLALSEKKGREILEAGVDEVTINLVLPRPLGGAAGAPSSISRRAAAAPRLTVPDTIRFWPAAVR